MKDYKVHASSIIDEDVIIGNGTKIWHFTHISAGAIIGENCNIGQNVFIGKGVKIGNGVKIQNNVSIYESVEIEDNVFIGPSVVFTNVINPRAFIERKSEFMPTLIRYGASLGANSTIICGVKIGQFALIGAGSVVTKDVNNFSLIYGNPGLVKGWIDRFGHKLIFIQNNESVSRGRFEYKLNEDGNVEEHDRS